MCTHQPVGNVCFNHSYQFKRRITGRVRNATRAIAMAVTVGRRRQICKLWVLELAMAMLPPANGVITATAKPINGRGSTRVRSNMAKTAIRSTVLPCFSMRPKRLAQMGITMHGRAIFQPRGRRDCLGIFDHCEQSLRTHYVYALSAVAGCGVGWWQSEIVHWVPLRGSSCTNYVYALCAVAGCGVGWWQSEVVH